MCFQGSCYVQLHTVTFQVHRERLLVSLATYEFGLALGQLVIAIRDQSFRALLLRER